MEEARKIGVSRDRLENDLSLRKDCVDRAWSLMKQKVARMKEIPQAVTSTSSFNRDFLERESETDFNDDLPPSSSNEEEDDDDIEDFSDVSGILSDDETTKKEVFLEDTRRLKQKQREYAPNGRKQRGYHKWAGRCVALLSTGETGIVVKRPGGRIKVRLDAAPTVEISSSEEKLHLMEIDGLADPDLAVDEIFNAARLVPQYKDLKIGQRVALVRLDNATGKIEKLPDEKRAMIGLGHVVVEMDIGHQKKKSVIESLRMLGDDHPPIPPPSNSPQKIVGRPTKATALKKTLPPTINPIVPFSKRGDDWRRSLQAPTGRSSPPTSPEVNVHEKKIVKRVKPIEDANKPALTRGQKLCRSCHAIIGTASKVCPHCQVPCWRRPLLKTDEEE